MKSAILKSWRLGGSGVTGYIFNFFKLDIALILHSAPVKYLMHLAVRFSRRCPFSLGKKFEISLRLVVVLCVVFLLLRL